MQLLSVFLFFAAISGVLCSDPDPLQDFCVADYSSGTYVNGYACKDPAEVTAKDFHFSDLGKAGVPNNTLGTYPQAAGVDEVPGLNTMGISMARVDFLPGGVVPAHTHPRATEAMFVLKGELDISFITTADVVMTKTVKKGGIFVAPRGLIHYAKNKANKSATYLSSFNSQVPATQVIPEWMLNDSK